MTSPVGGAPGPAPAVHRRWIWVFGEVQGVAYRAGARQAAADLGLVGFVHNRVDGSVELCAEGARVDLDRLLAWCRRGSPRARVERLEQRDDEATGEFADFAVRR